MVADWNSAATFVTNLEMQSCVLESTSVRQFSGKNYSNTRYAGLVQCALESLLYYVWITSWLSYLPSRAALGRRKQEERTRVQNALRVTFKCMSLQCKGETEMLFSSLGLQNAHRLIDRGRFPGWYNWFYYEFKSYYGTLLCREPDSEELVLEFMSATCEP